MNYGMKLRAALNGSELLPDGRLLLSSPATANTPINLFPWNAGRALAIKLIQPTVEFVSLRLRQRYRTWARGKAVPQLLQKLEPLFGAKGRYVDGHTEKV